MEKFISRLIFIFFLFVQTVPIFGQSKKIKLSEISFFYGIQIDRHKELNYYDFKSMVSNSLIFSDEKSNFSYHNLSLGNSTFNNSFASYLLTSTIGFSFEKFKNGLFRTGLIYGNTKNQFNTDAYHSEIIGHDTLYSSQGTPIYIDVSRTKILHSNLSSKKVLLDISYIYKFPEEHKIVMYGGLGLLFGIGFNSNIVTNYYESVGVAGSSILPTTIANNHEDLKLKPYFLSSIYVPLGLNIRLGNKNNFLKNIQIFGEIRPIISFLKFPTTRTFFLVGENTNLGIKVNL